MRWMVVSESVKHIRRDESYTHTLGPAIPGGVLHGMSLDADRTLCETTIQDLHVWDQLSFPRTFGANCPSCMTTVGDQSGAAATLVEPVDAPSTLEL